MRSFKHSLFYGLLYLVPKNLVSRLMGFLVSLTPPRSVAIYINKCFARMVGINIEEAEKPLKDYPNLQAFFIRKLKPGLRPIASTPNAVVSPCDGFVSSFGQIRDGSLYAIKGSNYSLTSLLDAKDLAARFDGGFFTTIYLSPRDYHRFHAPLSGEIVETTYIPGALWPVNRWAVNNIPNLFCQNERIISLIKPQGQPKLLAYIAVGATMVGKIKLSYCDLESNVKSPKLSRFHQAQNIIKGSELGMFMFGSTIILLFEPGLIDGFALTAPQAIKMGEIIALMK